MHDMVPDEAIIADSVPKAKLEYRKSRSQEKARKAREVNPSIQQIENFFKAIRENAGVSASLKEEIELIPTCIQSNHHFHMLKIYLLGEHWRLYV